MGLLAVRLCAILFPLSLILPSAGTAQLSNLPLNSHISPYYAEYHKIEERTAATVSAKSRPATTNVEDDIMHPDAWVDGLNASNSRFVNADEPRIKKVLYNRGGVLKVPFHWLDIEGPSKTVKVTLYCLIDGTKNRLFRVRTIGSTSGPSSPPSCGLWSQLLVL